MLSILHREIIQQLSSHKDLLENPSPDKPTIKWKGRSVSETNVIRLQLQRLLKPEQKREYTNSYLLDRICKICNIDDKHKNFLQSLSKTSPKEVAAELTEAIVNTATLEQKPDEMFYQELQVWVDQGEKDERRAEASEKILLAYRENATELNLSYLDLKTLPEPLKYLTHLNKLDCSCNALTELPDIFDQLSNLSIINLDHNPISHFPETLYSINRNFTVSIIDTPLLNTKITPGIEKKLSKYSWEIGGDITNIFDKSKEAFLSKIQVARNINLEPENYIELKQITNNNDDDFTPPVKEMLADSSHPEKNRITNQEQLQDNLTTCSFSNMRFVSCGEKNSPINIFCCEHPPRKLPSQYPSKIPNYLNTLKFIHNETDTVLSLVERDNQNQVVPFLRDCAGNTTYHPTKVLSMPIPDFSPPRYNHYLTLAKEMIISEPSKHPKGILLFCNAGRGRSGTMLTGAIMIDEFKKLDDNSRKKLCDLTRNHTPNTYRGYFPLLENDLKTTPFIGNIIDNLRKLEQDTTTDGEGRSIETRPQFRSLELLQYMLILSDKINENPTLKDSEILDLFNKEKVPKDMLELFFQTDYTQPNKQVILDAIKQFHIALSTV